MDAMLKDHHGRERELHGQEPEVSETLGLLTPCLIPKRSKKLHA